MNYQKIQLEPNGATLTSYIRETNVESLGAILVLPGGGYRYCAPGEGEPVALAYASVGYDAFVLEYSCLEGAFGSPKKEKDEVINCAMDDVKSAFDYLLNKGYQNKQIVLIGFSAGANLAMSSIIEKKLNPLCVLLGYGAFGDEMNALGLKTINLIEKINEEVPPAFLFLCQGDQTVSSLCSIELAKAYASKKVPFEMHCYVSGDHGLSLGTKASGVVNKDYSTWFNHSLSFIKHLNSDIPLVLGDIEDDLKEINVSSRIGALMYDDKAWELIKKYFPDIAFKAETDSAIRSIPFQRLYQWGLIKEPDQKTFNEMLEKR